MGAKTINQRRIYFIEKKFQAHFILKFCFLVIFGSILIGIGLYLFSWRSTTVTFENLRAVVKTTSDFILPILIQTIIVVSIFVGIATIILTLFISHKIAGPLYRFKKELKTIESGDLTHDFRIRKNDQLQEVALSINSMIGRLREILVDLKNQYQILVNSRNEFLNSTILEDKKKHSEKMKEAIVEIKKKLDYFKT